MQSNDDAGRDAVPLSKAAIPESAKTHLLPRIVFFADALAEPAGDVSTL